MARVQGGIGEYAAESEKIVGRCLIKLDFEFEILRNIVIYDERAGSEYIATGFHSFKFLIVITYKKLNFLH